ncbi:MAG: type II toxin-antitoxin system RelE/ParE family toxin [Acidobacteriota bacterium]
MARYSVRIKTSAIKEIEAISPKRERRRIVRRIEDLGDDPWPRGCQKLAGQEERYRVRQGRYRIVYKVDDTGGVVEVFKVGHRRDVYR